MAELKTQVNNASVTKFLNSIKDETKRADAYELLAMLQKATGEEPKMWGSSIVGFGDYHYVYASGREGDWFLTGFSPRKQNLTLYAVGSSWEEQSDLLDKLGKHSLGKGCLYINKLADVDTPTLKKLIDNVVKQGKKQSAVDAGKKEQKTAAKKASKK